MLRSFRLGRALGIPLYVHSTFFVIPLWVAFASLSQGISGILFSEILLLTVFLCVLLHELGHAMAARFFDIETADITFYPIGGVARLASLGSTPLQEMIIALAGPAVNLLILILLAPFLLFALSADPLEGRMAAMVDGSQSLFLGAMIRFGLTVWFCNLMLLAFNLLPAFPMDGGRVLRAVLSMFLGKLRGTEIAATVGLVVACGIGLLGLFGGTPTVILVALFVCFAGQLELRALRRAEIERRTAQVSVQIPGAETVSDGFTGFAWDVQTGAWIRWQNGRPVEMYG